MYQHFIPLSCQIIFHCMDIGPFVYSCLCWWTFRLCGSWCAVRTFCCSVTKSCPTLLPCGLYHARLPCPSASPRVGSNSCSLSWWCHPTISSSVSPFFSWLPSFPASASFPMSQLFVSDGQSIGASASARSVNWHLSNTVACRKLLMCQKIDTFFIIAVKL